MLREMLLAAAQAEQGGADVLCLTRDDSTGTCVRADVSEIEVPSVVHAQLCFHTSYNIMPQASVQLVANAICSRFMPNTLSTHPVFR